MFLLTEINRLNRLYDTLDPVKLDDILDEEEINLIRRKG